MDRREIRDGSTKIDFGEHNLILLKENYLFITWHSAVDEKKIYFSQTGMHGAKHIFLFYDEILGAHREEGRNEDAL